MAVAGLILALLLIAPALAEAKYNRVSGVTDLPDPALVAGQLMRATNTKDALFSGGGVDAIMLGNGSSWIDTAIGNCTSTSKSLHFSTVAHQFSCDEHQTPFNDITTGTNTVAMMICGVGCQLGVTGMTWVADGVTHPFPTGNLVSTLNGLTVQTTTGSATTREFAAHIGLTSNKGNAGSVNKVALFAAADGLSGTGDLWAANFLTTQEAGSGSYNSYVLEADFNNVNAHRGDTDGATGLAAPTAYGLAFPSGFGLGTASGCGSGAGIGFRSTSALLVSGPGGATNCIAQIWNRGLTFANNSVALASIVDYGNPLRSFSIEGTPTWGFVELSTGAKNWISGHSGFGIGGNTISQLATASPTNLVQLASEDSGNRGLDLQYSGSDTSGAVARFRKARGTTASPTAVSSGDTLAIASFGGYDGSAFQSGAELLGRTAETFSSTNKGSQLCLRTVQKGASKTIADRLCINDDGLMELEDTDLISSCPASKFGIYADTSEGKLKKCQAGVLTDLDTAMGGASTFDGIGTGVNTTATMTCGTGCSITVSGTGSNKATIIPAPGPACSGGNLMTNFSTAGVPTCAAVSVIPAPGPGCSAGAAMTNFSTAGVPTCTTVAAAFASISGGTNASAAMVVGTGASVSTSGTGTVAATSLSKNGAPTLLASRAGLLLSTTATYLGAGVSNTDTEVQFPLQAGTYQNIRCLATGGTSLNGKTITAILGNGTCGSALTYTSKAQCTFTTVGTPCSDQSGTTVATDNQCGNVKLTSSTNYPFVNSYACWIEKVS